MFLEKVLDFKFQTINFQGSVTTDLNWINNLIIVFHPALLNYYGVHSEILFNLYFRLVIII